MLLVIDNYDSFSHNLARYLSRLGQDVRVVRNDVLCVAEIQRQRPAAIVLSPGPRTPKEAGCCQDVVRALHDRVPILGVCLGHQVIVAALGGTIVRSPRPMHGRASQIIHDGRDVFQMVPNPFVAGRYHSLVAQRDTLPPTLRVSAETHDGVIMAVRHRHHLVVGLQFHPESILTECGYEILANFLRLAGIHVPGELPKRASELLTEPAARPELPTNPVTF